MPLESRRYFLKRVAAGTATAASGLILPGCGFFKANYIETRAKEIRETREKLFDEYKDQDQLELRKYEDREETPFWIVNGDGTHTLYYKVAYGDMENIGKVLAEQIKDTIISTHPNLNQFIITTQDEGPRSRIEQLLYTLDRAPDHVRVRVQIWGEVADSTRDYSSQFEMALKEQGERSLTTITADSRLSGAEQRLTARGTIVNRWGWQLEAKDFTVKAFMDMLELEGFLVNLYQSDMLIANGKTNKVGEKEQLLIPAYILAGVTPVETFNLADVVSNVEVNGIIHNGLVETTLKAEIGSTKRPDVRRRVEVPVQSTAEINNVYLAVGEYCGVAGLLKDFEIGIIRRDPIFRLWPSGQDYQHRLTKLWFMVSPTQIIQYDPNTSVWPFAGKNPFADMAASTVSDPNRNPDPNSITDPNSFYGPPKPLLRVNH